MPASGPDHHQNHRYGYQLGLGPSRTIRVGAVGSYLYQKLVVALYQKLVVALIRQYSARDERFFFLLETQQGYKIKGPGCVYVLYWAQASRVTLHVLRAGYITRQTDEPAQNQTACDSDSSSSRSLLSLLVLVLLRLQANWRCA
jgi:hypothetical protein